jgi:hypothetical protein
MGFSLVFVRIGRIEGWNVSGGDVEELAGLGLRFDEGLELGSWGSRGDDG